MGEDINKDKKNYIVHNPKLLILDEPTVGIDPQYRNHILSVIKQLRENGTTVIYTTHYMEEVEGKEDISVRLEYSTELFKEERIKKLYEHYTYPKERIEYTIENSNTDVVNKILEAVYKFSRDYFKSESVPVLMVVRGREYEEKKYYDLIGNCIDVIPVVLEDKNLTHYS